MTIDRKFIFEAVNPCNKKQYNQDNAIVFVAKDQCLIPVLRAYYKACDEAGCGTEHLVSIEMLIGRVLKYQKYNFVKLPDTDTDCEIDRCIGGKGL